MSAEEFTITTPVVYKILSVCETLVIAALCGLYIYTTREVNTVGIIVILATVVMLCITVDLIVDRTAISGSQLIRERLFHKTKVVEMRNISFVKIKKNLFRENLVFYENEKEITKVWVKNNAFHYLQPKLAKEKIHYRK